MSGRGLGHTGGTIDKLESIPGFRIDLSREEFFDIVKKHGLAVTGQSGDLAPADKKIYALRDVTATVDSIPLIASSIMSKKLALGSDGILLDVTVGSGAFMKNYSDALKLALCMASIGNSAGRATAVLVTDMDTPLGNTIGNALELSEAIDVLKGQGPKDLREVCIELAAAMLQLAGKGTLQACRSEVIKVLDNGAAYAKLCDMVAAQGGDLAVIHHPERLPKARFQREIKAQQSGYITAMDAELCGIASMQLGAGREKLGDTLDPAAGIVLLRKTGDSVSKGDVIAVLQSNDEGRFQGAEKTFLKALQIGETKPKMRPLVLARIGTDGHVEKYFQE